MQVSRLCAFFLLDEYPRYLNTLDVVLGTHHRESGYAAMYAQASWQYTSGGESPTPARYDAANILVSNILERRSGPEIGFKPGPQVSVTTNLVRVSTKLVKHGELRLLTVQPKLGTTHEEWYSKIAHIYRNPLAAGNRVYFRIYCGHTVILRDQMFAMLC